MKKISLFALTIIIVIFIYSSEIGYVKKLNGELFIKTFRDSIEIHEGYIISSKDILSTQMSSFATLCFADKDLDIMMKSSSEIICTGNYKDGNIEKSITLLSGSIFVDLNDGKLNVKFKNNLINMNQGLFVINVDNDLLEVICMDGDCELQNSIGSIGLHSGETGESATENPPHKLITDNIPIWHEKAYSEKQTICIEFTDTEGNIRLLEIIVD